MVRSGAVKTILRLFAVLLTALLALALVRQTAFAKTYVITDGDRVVTYTTFATDPAEVLDQAGLTLEQYDTYTTQTGRAWRKSPSAAPSVSRWITTERK